ncbi:MAG: A/G-specific adenine glycosylase, partial [Flavobacteriales bacterium]
MPSRSWFSKALLPWFAENKRDLPWRNTTDPYRIWLSEVILQQTRVDQGLAYWKRFVERWPTVTDLARASEDEVLKEWQGLGYYSRARNLRSAALQVVHEHRGVYPTTHVGLLKLIGVGDYTAAAIASICFSRPEAVVDGNAYRVLARVFGIATPIDSTAGKKEFKALANTLIDPDHPGDHNQAVMELGATVCTPRNPDCGSCPLRNRCVALKESRIATLPVKVKKQVVRVRYFNYLVLRSPKGIFLHQRSGKDIWQGLWEFPLIETGRPAN